MMAFANFLAKDEKTRLDPFTWAEALQLALHELESKAETDTFYDEYLKNMYWPGTTCSREMLIRGAGGRRAFSSARPRA